MRVVRNIFVGHAKREIPRFSHFAQGHEGAAPQNRPAELIGKVQRTLPG